MIFANFSYLSSSFPKSFTSSFPLTDSSMTDVSAAASSALFLKSLNVLPDMNDATSIENGVSTTTTAATTGSITAMNTRVTAIPSTLE